MNIYNVMTELSTAARCPALTDAGVTAGERRRDDFHRVALSRRLVSSRARKEPSRRFQNHGNRSLNKVRDVTLEQGHRRKDHKNLC